MIRKKFPSYIQHDITDCGPTCLRIISKYYGREISLDAVRELSEKTRVGTNLLSLSEAAEKLGYNSLGAKITFDKLAKQVPLPAIVFWQQEHFCVIYRVTSKKVYLSDPSGGLLALDTREFLKGWTGSPNGDEGIVLLLEPTEEFFERNTEKKIHKAPFASFRRVFSYFFKFKKLFAQALIGLFCGSLINLFFPFLTQGIIDVGIANQDIDFIYLLLLAQVFLFIGSTTIEILRRVILMHISSRVNIYLLSDFFKKLFRLPISFYDAKMTGDILQRIGDHQRVEALLTSGTLSILFSMVNLVVFGAVLIYYNWGIFALFALGSALFFWWIKYFLKRRAEIDFLRFNQNATNSEKTLELIYGMQEIKLSTNETRKRWEWEYLQAKLFEINLKGLALDNWQNGGASLINQLKNILITFYAATLVLNGQLSLGMMLSISYIIGQMNVPLSQLLEFMQSYQDANLSMDRINDVYKQEEEENPNQTLPLPKQHSIQIRDLYFRYQGTRKDNFVLRGLDLHIPENKVTAIVGSSGSGKTTLMKLLLKFYEPSRGEISISGASLNAIPHRLWRKNIGAVMQDGFLFPDTIGNNIAVVDDKVDRERLIQSADIACIREFIESLPMGYETKIGATGMNLSAGQKQRILIARAVYKNPQYLFFDEATSALDAKNERQIKENLDHFFAGKTVVVIAHRLSTVKNADQILVLDDGQITECGSHDELIAQQGDYFNLIRNQLEIGV